MTVDYGPPYQQRAGQATSRNSQTRKARKARRPAKVHAGTGSRETAESEPSLAALLSASRRMCLYLNVCLQRQQEMLRYQQGKSDWLAQVKPAPTFYPTAQQFEDPIAYIRSIQAEGSQHGMPSGLCRRKFVWILEADVRLACRHLQNCSACSTKRS